MDEHLKITRSAESIGLDGDKLDVTRVRDRMVGEFRSQWPPAYGVLDNDEIGFGFHEVGDLNRSFVFTAWVDRRPEPPAGFRGGHDIDRNAKLVVLADDDLKGHTSDCFQPRLGADQLVFFRGRDGSVLFLDEATVDQIKAWTGGTTLDARLLAARLSDAAERAEAVTLMWNNA